VCTPSWTLNPNLIPHTLGADVGGSMRKSRFATEQIVGFLKEQRLEAESPPSAAGSVSAKRRFIAGRGNSVGLTSQMQKRLRPHSNGTSSTQFHLARSSRLRGQRLIRGLPVISPRRVVCPHFLATTNVDERRSRSGNITRLPGWSPRHSRTTAR
jgi:hypothetical protein